MHRYTHTSQRVGIRQSSGLIRLAQVLERAYQSRDHVLREVWRKLGEEFPLAVEVRVCHRVAAEVVAEHLQKVVAQECCCMVRTTSGPKRKQLTIARTVGEQNEPEVRVNSQITFPLLDFAHPSPVRKRQLTMSCEAPEDGNNVFSSLVGLVDDHDTAVRDGPQEGRVAVLECASREHRGKHQLVDGGITVELNVFARTAEQLSIVSTGAKRFPGMTTWHNLPNRGQ